MTHPDVSRYKRSSSLSTAAIVFLVLAVGDVMRAVPRLMHPESTAVSPLVSWLELATAACGVLAWYGVGQRRRWGAQAAVLWAGAMIVQFVVAGVGSFHRAPGMRGRSDLALLVGILAVVSLLPMLVAGFVWRRRDQLA